MNCPDCDGATKVTDTRSTSQASFLAWAKTLEAKKPRLREGRKDGMANLVRKLITRYDNFRARSRICVDCGHQALTAEVYVDEQVSLLD